MDPPVETARAQSELFTVQCCQWEPKADDPPILTHEVTNTEFEMKYPDRLLLTLVVKNGNVTFLLIPSCQGWQFHIATDI